MAFRGSTGQPNRLARPLLVGSLLAVLGLAFALRWRAADHGYLSQWDEAYHALVAKNFLSHPLVPTLREEPLFPVDVTDWSDNHVWLHKPPLAPWLMALGLAVFGPQSEV